MSSIDRWLVLLVGLAAARLAVYTLSFNSPEYTVLSVFVGFYAVWVWFKMAKMDGVFPLRGEGA